MGGFGSNRWGGYSRRRRVSESLSLDVGDFYKYPIGVNLVVSWGNENSVRLVREDDRFRLNYCIKKSGVNVEEALPIIQHSSGRWYWVCSGCDRQAVKLFKPYEETIFRCRICHDLSYRSVQERRKYQGLARFLARDGVLSEKEWEQFLTTYPNEND